MTFPLLSSGNISWNRVSFPCLLLEYIPYDSGVRKSCAPPQATMAKNAKIKVVLRMMMVVSCLLPRRYTFFYFWSWYKYRSLTC